MPVNLSVNTLPGPDDIVRTALPNGIVVLVRENHHAESVVVAGSLDAGAVFDPVGREGTASLAASMLLRGTENYDFRTLHDTLERNGAKLSIAGGMHTTGFGGKSLNVDLGLIIELLAEGLRRPTFDAQQLERLRGETITDLRTREQSTRYMAGRSFRTLVYPNGHPYQRLSVGQIDTVAKISRDMLIEFWQQHYHPAGMIIVVVGAVKSAHVLRLVETHFADWAPPVQTPAYHLPPVGTLSTQLVERIIMRDKSQSDLVLGVVGPSRYDPDWETARLANSILGVFGMYGRLGAQIREKLGMAYYSYSRLEGGFGPGAWMVQAGVNPSNVSRAVDETLDVIRAFLASPVSDEELADNKANFTGRLPLQLESNEGVAGMVMMMERYGLGLDYLRRYPDIINRITAEEILAVARRFLSVEHYAIAVAGPDAQPPGGR